MGLLVGYRKSSIFNADKFIEAHSRKETPPGQAEVGGVLGEQREE